MKLRLSWPRWTHAARPGALRSRRVAAGSAFVLAAGLVLPLAAALHGQPPGAVSTAAAGRRQRVSAAGNGPAVRHVVVIDLDNTHLADMLAMPAVRAWFRQGTVMANDHTDLVSYTHPDYLNEVTGLYDSRTGIMSNFQYDNGHGLSFSYWLDKLPGGAPTHLSAPPWRWWNARGDSVGAVGWADLELENASEVSQYVTVAHGYTADNYLGFAIHEADGKTVFGTPNVPYVMNAHLLADPSQTVGVHSGSWDANFGPDRSLTAAAALLTHGVQVVFDYIRTVHNSPTTGNSLAPGTAAYQASIDHYNRSFAAFFSYLKAHGLTPANTLVVMTSDEGDHYNPGGEIDTDAPAWFTRVGLPTSKLTIDGSAANLVYWPAGTRVPLAGLARMPGWRYLVWGAALSAIHVATAVPADNPQLIQFAEPSWYYNYSGTSTALTTNPAYLWNHGTVAGDINALWASFVGPGVPRAVTSQEWVDSTGLLPTIQKLATGQVEAGLDGVVMDSAVASLAGRADRSRQLAALTATYEMLNAPVGPFSQTAMQVSSTAAIEPGVRAFLMGQLGRLVARRAPVASALHRLIASGDDGGPVPPGQARRLTAQADALISAITTLAEHALLR
jgi:hypothetical protein